MILVTGGAGYIGSHTCVELINAGYDVVIVDNFSNSKELVIGRLEKITGKRIKLYKADICDKAALKTIFKENQIDMVIHFAGLKAVGESIEKPLEYYDNNVVGTVVLCEVMKEFDVKKIVFSSSATVYGMAETVPMDETLPISAINPYGRTKCFIEDILRDICVSDGEWKAVLLRYFNPIGAHESGLIGEDPGGIPNNLFPYITQVAVGKLEKLKVFGSDYPTKDGTGVRDYIHVVDLAKGHVKAVEAIEKGKIDGAKAINLGTGKGYSVLEVVKAFEKISGVKIPYEITTRRAGDIAECYADPSLAKKVLDWQTQYGIEKMCADSWNWQKNNPDGYNS